MLITVKEYSRAIGKADSSVRRMILRGNLPAQKIGRDWLIDENTPYPDNRVKSGKYKNWRKKEDAE